jgi:uroporphyrinogen III methyltransferase/synthase
MGVRTLPGIVEQLLSGGLAPETPAAAVRWGTYPRQETVVATLATLVERVTAARLGAPVITVIGSVVSLRESIAWFDTRPLFGVRILVTRAQSPTSTLSARLAAAGADVIELPATRIEPVQSEALPSAIAGIQEYDWVVFTSQNAVRVFWDALREAGGDARVLGGARIAAVGPSTDDALLSHGLAVDVTPERFVAEGVLDAMRARGDVRGARVLYAAAEGARDVLPKGLEALGARVDRVALYRSVPEPENAEALRRCIEEGALSLATFTSASSVRAFVEIVGPDAARRIRAATIGPVTSEAARAAGLEVEIEAAESTMEGLVAAIVRHVRAAPA